MKRNWAFLRGGLIGFGGRWVNVFVSLRMVYFSGGLLEMVVWGVRLGKRSKRLFNGRVSLKV
ncbi:hypothetical protein BDV34DRAFT_188550 [Aspergillus parasiticus]|uniref:Uncharacterized protein n=1 Tax=Aspergillus parasiticus TaxID=5067 RepID=A0A5N6DWR8_ASPPA|nr:hypothetical protein BDV34DRAFT_188550 [Aspergillus parasiticus]